MEHFYSLNRYFRETFGCKGYKLALQGGMTCPNRDGTLGTRGCIFCSGSSEFAETGETVTEQIAKAAERVKSKNKNGKYIAYFQDHTNTYAPVSVLKQKFSEAIAHPDVAVLSVATRPDCLPDEVLSLLSELNRQKPVWVELGLQTIHDTTADFLRRGYPTGVYDEAVRKLHFHGISVVTHLILGLPGETPEMLFETVKHIGDIGTDGVKFHLLHILKGTDLAALYKQGKISALSFPEYASLLSECIRLLPRETVVHRITGDGDKRTLLAPLWSADKKHVLNSLNAYFDEHDVFQSQKRG